MAAKGLARPRAAHFSDRTTSARLIGAAPRARLYRSFNRINGDLFRSFNSTGLRTLASRRATAILLSAFALYASSVAQVLAHDVTPGDAGYIQEIWGVHMTSFI